MPGNSSSLTFGISNNSDSSEDFNMQCTSDSQYSDSQIQSASSSRSPNTSVIVRVGSSTVSNKIFKNKFIEKCL